MRSYPPSRVRNVAIVGHGGVGKTTLVEALAHASGALTRAGRVEDHTTLSDFTPEEHKRAISLGVALVPIEWHDTKLNLLDTPGYPDFRTEAAEALSVADLAVFVVSATEGVEPQTEILWKLASEAELPRMIFVNKLDRDQASFTQTLESLQESFGAGIAPLELPIGEGADHRGVIDLLSDTAITYHDGQPTSGPIPDDMAGREHSVHETLVEGIVVADDDLMTRYLDGEVPSVEELEKTLAHGVASASVFPVVLGSAVAAVGVDRLATFLCEIGSSPLDRPPAKVTAGGGTEGETNGAVEVDVVPDPSGPPLLWVWKTLADPYVGKISLFKVLSGTLRPDSTLTNSRTHRDERIHSLFTLRGKEQLPEEEIVAGDLGALSKLAETSTGDTLSARGNPVRVVPPVSWPDHIEPALRVAIKPHSKGDEDKLMTALHRLCEEDPALSVRRDDETHQTVLGGAGETHLAVSMERLARAGVAVEVEDLLVPYRETITHTAEAEGKYKKQTGGHGQFGVASIRTEPMERGQGFEFVDQIVGGAIPRQFIPAVAKGIEEAMSSGGVYGYPVVDVRATCFDGKYHPVDSSELAFKMAGALAFREAMAKAGPVLLEPVSLLEVTVPDAYQGDVMGDLNSRRGRVQGTDQPEVGWSVITALVPSSELVRYAIDLRSLTGARGQFRVSHSHYDTLPAHLVEKVRRSNADS